MEERTIALRIIPSLQTFLYFERKTVFKIMFPEILNRCHNGYVMLCSNFSRRLLLKETLYN